jgi:NAD(P)-dependent dehydrogenase (short-subunit alcohol dehydrogenase family)
LGRAAAISFAQSGASHITLGARSSLESIKNEVIAAATAAKRPAPTVLCLKLDMTSQSSTEYAAQTIGNEFGKLDIVVIYAGIVGAMEKIVDSEPEVWWNTFTVNLKGPYMVTRAILPLMLKGGDKTIVTVSSVGAHLTSPTLSAYQPSKLAVLRFMEFVGAEYGDQGVVAYCVHPGNVVTDILGGEEGIPPSLRHGKCG